MMAKPEKKCTEHTLNLMRFAICSPRKLFFHQLRIQIFFFPDHVITSLAEDIFKVIASTPGYCGPLEGRLIPTLVSILDAEGDKVTSALQSVALDILQALVRGAGSNKGVELSQLLVANAFPAAVRCTLHSDDNSVTQVNILKNPQNLFAKLSKRCQSLMIFKWLHKVYIERYGICNF